MNDYIVRHTSEAIYYRSCNIHSIRVYTVCQHPNVHPERLPLRPLGTVS